MQYNFKKVGPNKYEFISQDGQRKTYDESALVTLKTKGHEVLVDGKQYYITPSNASSAKTPSSEVIYNFNTTDYKYFVYDKSTKQSDVTKLISNINKGLKLTVNHKPIKLSKDGTTIEFVNPQDQAEYLKIINKSFDISKKNIDSINAQTPPTSTSSLARNVTLTSDGKYIYKNKLTNKAEIIASLIYGKIITINGKLIALNDTRDDYVFVDPETINKLLRSKANTAPIDLKYINHDSFYYEKLGRSITRADVLTNLRKGKHITIDGRELAITPDGNDFGYLEEVEAMKKQLKSEAEINKEAEAADVKIVKVPNTHRNYFGSVINLGEEPTDTEQTKSVSFSKMKQLQDRLFNLSANSNVINIDSKGVNNSFDLVAFINKYQKLRNQKDIFKQLFSTTPVYFDLSSEGKEIKKLWKQILELNQAAQDSQKEHDDTFLNLGYPTICDTIIEPKKPEQKEPPKPIKINAPLFFLKTRLILNVKEKQFRFDFDKHEGDFVFKANKELLLYLATQLQRHPNVLKYEALFNENSFYKIDVLIKEMKNYFDFLDIKFDADALLSIIQQMDSTEKIDPTIHFDQNASGQAVNGVRVVPNCFIGVFKQTNADIAKDYDRLLERKEGRDFWSELVSMVPEQLQYYIRKGADFKEADLRQIVELDYSQKTACKLALTGSLNIVGPAGTGKSQTISNILANFIDRHESALFCAEKKTATDVVSNRMKNLRYYILPLFAKENWNETLTKAIRQNLKRVGTIYGQWKPLKLDDKENIKDTPSQILDSNFEKIAKYREIMTSSEGYNLPKTIIEFSSGEMHEQIEAVETLCYSIFENSHTAVEFWTQINEAKHAKDLWESIQKVLGSIGDPEFTGESEAAQDKLNRLLKAIKYYNSKTIWEDELVQILQEEKCTEEPIVKDPNLKNNPHFDAFISDPKYIKFKNVLRSLIKAQAAALNMIQQCKGFVTWGTIKALKTKHEMATRQNQALQYQNNQYYGNAYGQQYNPQMGQQPFPQQYNQQNQFLYQQPVNGQYIQQPQQVVQYGPNGAPIYPQPSPPQQTQQPIPEVKQELTEEEKIEKFVSKYNKKNFKFNAIKHYYDLEDELEKSIQAKAEKEAADYGENSKGLAESDVDMNLDVAAWLDQTQFELKNKISNDLKLAELHFLSYVRNQIESDTTFITQYNQLYGIVDNNETLKDVQDTLLKYGQIISLLFPIIIASPNLVCKYMDPTRKLFDHVVIDEASMLSLERAIPLLYRGDKYVIVGDSKQLKPLSSLEQRKRVVELRELVANGEADPKELKAQADLVHEYQGVLDFVAPLIPKTTLQYHYRSVKTECVKFSSTVFYDKEMITADNFTDHKAYLTGGLKVINVDGEYKNGINIKECDALYAKLVEIARANKEILDSDEKISVGIIVFTQQQKNYLDNLILQKSDPDVLAMKMMLNSKTGEDSSLFIKDIESVQGDERDIILMSLGSSSKSKLSIVESLGLINSELGSNFLNVMITRARQQLIIFKSFEAIDVPTTGQRAVDYYRDFIKYIDLLSQPNTEKIQSELDNLFKPYEMRSATIDYSSLVTLEQEYLASKTGLIDLFNKHIDHTKYDIQRNVEPIQGQKFGIVVVDKFTKIPEFALIFDEFIKDIYKTPKQSQFYDYLFLNSRGWRFHKVTSLEWAYTLNEKEQEKAIKAFLKEKLTFDNKCYYVEEQPVEVKSQSSNNKETETSVKTTKSEVKVVKKVSKKPAAKKVAAKKPVKKAVSKKQAKKVDDDVVEEKTVKTVVKKTIKKSNSKKK